MTIITYVALWSMVAIGVLLCPLSCLGLALVVTHRSIETQTLAAIADERTRRIRWQEDQEYEHWLHQSRIDNEAASWAAVCAMRAVQS